MGAVPLALALVVAVRPSAFGDGRPFNVYNAAMAASVGVLVLGVGLRRPRPLWPWIAIAVTVILWVVGDLVYEAYGSEPTISFADVFYFSGYVTLVAGAMRLVHIGAPKRTVDGVLDMAIIGVTALYASWALVMEPAWNQAGVSHAARVVLISYPVLDAMPLVLLAQLLLRPRPTMSHLFLALGMSVVFAGDTVYAVLQQTDSFTRSSLLDATWPLGYSLIAMAALHPSVRAAPGEASRDGGAVELKGLVPASAAVLAIPMVAVFAYMVRPELDGASLLTASVWVFVLVSWRMLRLHRHAERAQAALDRSREHFRALAMTASDGYAIIAENGIVIDASPTLAQVIGWPRDEVVGQPLSFLEQLAHADDSSLRSLLERVRRAPDGASTAEGEVRLRRPDHSFGWVAVRATNLLDHPAVRGLVLNIRDVDARKHAERDAERQRAHLESAQQIAGVGSFEQDRSSPMVYPSPQLCRILGIPPVSEFDVLTLLDLVHPYDRPALGAAIQSTIETGEAVDVMHRIVRPDGGLRWVIARVARMLDHDESRMIGTVLDITERKEAEERLAHDRLHDPLTGLANRTLFLERLELALSQREGSDRPTAVLLMDVDDFKSVNDALGHTAGDELLCALAERLALVTREGDLLARLGGDEFAVLLGSGAMPRTAEKIARRIAHELAAPFRVVDTEVNVSVSIGISVAEPTRNTSEDLLRDVDLAMYLAKRRGKGRAELARPRMQDEALRHLGVVTDLRRAQAGGELEVFYQPVVAVEDGMPAGTEALIRWNHPQRGLVPPIEFINDAESTGLIVPIGDWILNEACRQTQAWREAGTVDDDFYVSVNLSPRQLAEPGLVANVARALRSSGLPPRALVLEITESTLMEDLESGVARLRNAKDLGLRVALDDYGTGYSSLNRLAKLPIDIVKIDKSFIDQLDEDAGRALVRSVVDVARALGIKTIAEGVERPEQRAILRRLGCDYMQGFLFARPIPAGESADVFRELAAGSGPRARPDPIVR